MHELAFEGELMRRKGQGDDIFDHQVRTAAARDAVVKSNLPVLKTEYDFAPDLVEREVTRLATHRGRF